ncbi:DUF4097 family beta strand repeat-containing protein [Streptococcus moroccensis]|nr:DUF4097 family beta strand repeat-containing protein [Streptococcus moroccensis]
MNPSESETDDQNRSETSQYERLPEFNHINIKLDYENVIIIASTDHSFGLSHPTLKSSIRYCVKNGVLDIESLKKDYRINSIGMGFRHFISKQFQETDNLIISLPKDYSLNNLSLNLGSGDFQLKELTILGCSIALGSGDVDVVDSKVHQTTVNTGSGDIELTSSHLEDVNLNTASGDIIVTNTQTNSSMIVANSGDIECKGGQISQVEMVANSGDIDLDMHYKGLNKIETSSGDITIKGFEEHYHRLSVTAETLSGEIEVSLQDSGDRLFEGRYTHSVSAPSDQLYLQTNCGDISLG